MQWRSVMVGVVTMLIGLIVWELFVKKMVVKNAFESYYDSYDQDECRLRHFNSLVENEYRAA